MDVAERRILMEMVGSLIGGRIPYGVTVAEPSVPGQIAFARAASAAGADWVILQPPPGKGIAARDLIRFFGEVAEAVDLPVAVQNNPVNLDVSLSPDALVELNRAHPNVRILKGEGWSVRHCPRDRGLGRGVRGDGRPRRHRVPALLRSGGAGLIPAPDFLPAHVAMWRAWREGRHEEAKAIHRRILPAIVFMSRSVPGMLCYGKRLMAEALGLPEPVERFPALEPTPFGLREMRRHASEIASAVRSPTGPE